MARISLIIYLLVHTFHVSLNYTNALETNVCVDFQLEDTIIWYDDFSLLRWTGNNNVTNGKLKRYHGWYVSNGSSSLIYKISRDFYCKKTVAYYQVFFTIYYGCNVGQNDTVNMYLNNDLQITAELGSQESEIYAVSNETSVIKCASNKLDPLQAQKWDYRFNTSTFGDIVFTKFQFTLSFDIHLSPQTQTRYIGISNIEIQFETPDNSLTSIGWIGLVIFAMGFCCFAATIRYSYLLIRRCILLRQTEGIVISKRIQICCDYKVKYAYVDVTMHYTRNLVFGYVTNHSNINNIPSEIINLCSKYLGGPIIGTGPYINEIYVSQKYYSSVNVDDEIDIRYDSKNPSNSNIISQGCSEETRACTIWMCLSICVMSIGTLIAVLMWTLTVKQYLCVTMFVVVILILIIMILWYNCKQRFKTMVNGKHYVYTRLINLNSL
eukprot:458443_1